MFFKKNKTDEVKELKNRIKELEASLANSEHRYATEIGKLAKAQLEWQSKAEWFVAYRANIQESLKQIAARNEFDKVKTGAIAGQLDYINKQFKLADENIVHGKKHIGN